MLWKKSGIISVFLLLMFSIINIPISSQSNVPWWDQNFSYRQELDIQIDTSLEIAKYQPVDIRITFNDPCFAKNTDEHSVRICCWDGKTWYELESQTYDLDHTDDTHIKACSLVFLIPKEANGKESYYVYYDDTEKPKVFYPDHVVITEEHYYYEPIPGQKADFDYYKIMDEGFCVYGVGLQGMMMTEYASQMIFRQSKGQKDLSYKYWDRLASFCFQYVDTSLPVGKDTITTRMKLLSNEIFLDGNLMVQFGIVSTTSREDAKTTNIYKYYYSPVDIKRICVNVKHETLKDIPVAGEEKVDGEYAFTSGFKTRSEANTFLNTGEILPYIHFYNKDETVKQVEADINPTARNEEWLISVEDDSDLGTHSWVCADNGETGKAHALIFSSNNIVKSGKDEQDGIQLKGSQKQEADIPGLKAYSSGIGCFRNAYKSSGSPDLSIPSDFRAEFDAEFFTTELNSYKDVENEAVLFQSLVKNRPTLGGNVSSVKEKEEKYTLKVLTHFAPSFPMGSLLSTFTGKNFSCTYAELYKNGSLQSTGVCGRLSLAGDMNLDFENKTIYQITKMIFGLFDWRNTSLFKKIVFPELSTGSYVIKIYIKTKDGNKYVGVQTIDLKKDTTTNIFCHQQGEIKITVNDQNNKPVPKAQCYLILGNMSIAEATTTEKEETTIAAPTGNYQLRIIYKGFKIHEKEIKIGLLQKEEKIKLTLSNLKLIVKDKLDLPPGIKIIPIMTSDEMETPLNIQSQEEKPGIYNFINLPSATYKIQISYKNYLDEKTVKIPDEDTASMIFSAIFKFTVNVYDARGSPLGDTKIVIKRDNKTLPDITDKDGVTVFEIPGGSYIVGASDNENNIGEKAVDILRDETTYLVTSKEPIFPSIIMAGAGALTLLSLVLVILKKIRLKTFLKILGIALILVALVLPWWQLYGSNASSVERTTNTYLLPQTMITTTVANNVQESELANVPAEFTIFLFAITIVAAVSILPILGSILLQKRKKISIVLHVFGIILLILTVSIFTYAFGELTKVGLGSLQGSGTLEILPLNSKDYVEISASWGLSSGFYLIVLTIILWIIASIFEKIYHRLKKTKR